LHPLVVFVIPTMVTVYLFEETYTMAFLQSMVRYCFSLHVTWLVNSAAHILGTRPYNEKIQPRESPLVIVLNVLGEGFHNYHHTYPSDYRASEFGWFMQLNVTCFVIDMLAKTGLVWDRKMASREAVEAAKKRVRDSHQPHDHLHGDNAPTHAEDNDPDYVDNPHNACSELKLHAE
jgi:stearoyl-CoA desaturase (delta-9 desaturase)